MTDREEAAVESREWPLVGRAEELAAFDAAWAEPSCRGFVIHGPSGVGKSRLAEECLARAVRMGFPGRQATASAAARSVPLGALAALVPAGVDLSDPAAVFAAVTGNLAGTGRGRPWVLLVDDLQLLDATSAVLLRQLLDARVVRLIATIQTGHSFRDAVRALTAGHEVYRLDLAELDLDQSDRLLQAALRGPVTRHAVRQLHTTSGGNLLYLHELVHDALTGGALRRTDHVWELAAGALPDSPRLTELIRSRLHATGPASQAVLELLALCEPLPLADAETTADIETLARLEEAGLVHAHQDGRRTHLTLTHPLYGEILRAGIPESRRRTLLLHQVDRIQARGTHRHDDTLRTTTWRLAATGTADPALLRHAAALARHAHDYEQVITLLDALPDEHHDTSTRMLHGEAHHQLGHHDTAEAILAAADRQARTDAERLMLAMERTQNLFWGTGRLRRALAVNDAAAAGVNDPAVRTALTVNEAAMRAFAGQPRAALSRLGAIEDLPDERVRLFGLAMKVVALAAVGRPGEAVRLAERAHNDHVAADPGTVVQHSTAQLGPLSEAYQALGDLRRAREAAERGLVQAPAVGAWTLQTGLAFTLGRGLWLAGRPADARRSYAEAFTRARDHSQLFLRLTASGLAAVCAVLGDTAAAESVLADFASYPRVPHLAGEERLGEAWLLVARGHPDRARTVLAEAAATAEKTGHLTTEALLRTDIARLGGARDVVDRLTELARLCDGPFASARAHLAAALATEDPTHLLDVTDELEHIGASLLAAEAATAAASAWHRAGRHRAATATAVRATTLAAQCQGARTPLLATAQTPRPLTDREREIALLAAAGTHSRDIAAALTLSVRTINNHLHRTYTKLGVTNRAELAQALTREPT